MADLNVGAFSVTQSQINQITSDVTQVVVRLYYDSTPTAGWTIVAEGPLGSLTLCPKPCGKVS